MMRWLVRLLILVVLCVPLALLALLFLALDDQPLVATKVVLAPAHIERAKWLLVHNDPRRMRPGVLRTVVISQEDLGLAGNYLAGRYARGSASVALLEGAAAVRASFEMPANPFGRYLNLDAVLEETAYMPRVRQLRIGRVAVPGVVSDWLVREGIARLQRPAEYVAAADVVKNIRSRNGMLSVVFVWSDDAAASIKSALVPARDQELWQAYQTRMAELTAAPGLGRQVPLTDLLLPLFRLAAQRAASGDPVAENRAALIVLAFYVNGKGLSALLPTARDWPAPTARVVTLAGRSDFPQHFTISAVLAATAGSPLSDAVGVYKEVDDARGGSGFSFNDIAADRAGTRFGELASSAAGAAKLYGALKAGFAETAYFPYVRDLPEFMTEQEFKRLFGGVGRPPYVRMSADIERRIAALPLYR